jgi:hypothetical protein
MAIATNPQDKQPRCSRFNPPPYDDPNDEPVLYESDRAILRALALDPYQTKEWLAFAVGRQPGGLRNRLYELKRARYIKVADEQRNSKEARSRAIREKLYLELDARGIALLKPQGIHIVEKTTKILEHQGLAAEVSVSFRSANGKMRYVPFSELLTRPETPKALITSEHPFTFKKLGYRYRDEFVKKDVRPDLPIAALERTDGEHTHEFFLVGGEVDNNTEPGQSSIAGRSSLERHFWEYIAIAEQRLYKSLYGFPHMYVPFVFSNPVQMQLGMRVLENIKAPMRAKRIFLFKVHSRIPNGDMVTGEWLRLSEQGFRPFSYIS